jgi:hypothetical protein
MKVIRAATAIMQSVKSLKPVLVLGANQRAPQTTAYQQVGRHRWRDRLNSTQKAFRRLRNRVIVARQSPQKARSNNATSRTTEYF